MQNFQTLHVYIGSAYNLSYNHYLIELQLNLFTEAKEKQQLSFFSLYVLALNSPTLTNQTDDDVMRDKHDTKMSAGYQLGSDEL